MYNENVVNNTSEFVKPDLKDRKILFHLDFNARASNAEIARQVGLSKQTVDYKIKNMIGKGVIAGFYPIINNPKLGYFYGRLFFRLHNVTVEKEKQIVLELVGNNKVNWLIRAEGGYDLWIATWTKSLSDFKTFSTEIFSKYGMFIKEMRESVGVELRHFQPRFLIGSKETKQISTKEEEVKEEIDEVDKKILSLLCGNARRPLVEMAAKLNISAKLLAYRIKRLEERGIILGYRPDINYSLLGYTHYKILFYLANMAANELQKFKSFLERDPRVIYTVNAIGLANFDVELMLKSQQEYFEFLRDVKFAFPSLIKEYETMIVMETLKVNYLPSGL